MNEDLRKRLATILVKLETFDREEKELNFKETGDTLQSIETLERVCNRRQLRPKEINIS